MTQELHMLPPSIEKYLQTRAAGGPWRIIGCRKHDFAGAVVIPALAESARLFDTLASLAANPPDLLDRFLVLVVVNHREDASTADKEDNHATLQALAIRQRDFPSLQLGWVDAASADRELPSGKGGVGFARKIGLDLSLQRLDHRQAPSLLVCLDADTLVESNYLMAILHHFKNTTAGGAAIPFAHQQGRSLQEQCAIERYELFLRHYILGLRIAGSPYAFHTVGSAMACTSDAYVRSGGMNMRAAGEDFYFLQHLSRTAGVAGIKGTTVYPSPRPSHRVPFGTGRSVSRWVGGDDSAITFYRPQCFEILGKWLQLVECSLHYDAADILARAKVLSPDLGGYLDTVRFVEVWGGLVRNNPSPGRLIGAFHGWFDGLKTMKLIHHLSAHGFPRCGPEEALPPLLSMFGAPAAGGAGAQLALLRQLEMADALP